MGGGVKVTRKEGELDKSGGGGRQYRKKRGRQYREGLHKIGG